MTGITAYGAYVPRHRLNIAEAAAALDIRGQGTRAVACHDEDTTTLAVAALRQALRGASASPPLWFGTANPAYADKSNAATVRLAAGLAADDAAIDVAGTLRSGFGALVAAASSGGLAALSDIQSGLPGSADEQLGGDAAAAFCFGEGDGVIAEVLARASASAEFLDRWRMPGALQVNRWEERFGAERYGALMRDTLQRVLAAAAITKPDYLVVSCPNARAVKAAARLVGDRTIVVGRIDGIGYAGAADVGLLLAHVLDQAGPGQSIVVLGAADGCDGIALRTTEALVKRRSPQPVSAQLSIATEVPYPRYLSWRGLLERQPPRRPEPEEPSPPAAARRVDWKFALVGAQCDACGQVHLPPQRVCAVCRATDHMREHPLAGRRARITTYTVDRLAYSLSPPVVAAVLDFDGGGRMLAELADVDPESVEVGAEVEMVFRRHYTSAGIHNYFWKACIVRSV